MLLDGRAELPHRPGPGRRARDTAEALDLLELVEDDPGVHLCPPAQSRSLAQYPDSLAHSSFAMSKLEANPSPTWRTTRFR